MRTLRAVEFLSLDGVMQSLGGPDEDTSGGFRHGGWHAEYSDDSLAEWAGNGLPTTEAFLFGRVTYEKLAAYWPTVSNDNPMARVLNTSTKYVVGTDLSTDWTGAELIGIDDVEQLAGSITVLGSGQLVRGLLDRDLIDELALVIDPIVIGSGKRLFGASDEVRKLRLVDSLITPLGVAVLTYHAVR